MTAELQFVIEPLREGRPEDVGIRSDDVVMAALVVDRDLVPLLWHGLATLLEARFYVGLECEEIAEGRGIGDGR